MKLLGLQWELSSEGMRKIRIKKKSTLNRLISFVVKKRVIQIL